MDRLDVAVIGLVLGFLVATASPYVLPLVHTSQLSVSTTPPTVPPQAGPEAQSGDPVDSHTATSAAQRGASRDVQCSAPPEGTRITPLRGFPLTLDGQPITGADVSVAVIDPSGFAVADPRIRPQIAATASFAATGELNITNAGQTAHGTATAATVARMVPDAELYVANFETAYDFTRAIRWAISRDVDVIVAPVAFYAKPNDGSAPVSQAVTDALNANIPVVVPTGNVAQQHWEGTYSGSGWLEFAPNDTRLYLSDTPEPVQIWLWWNRSDAQSRDTFRVVLYKDLGNRSKRIAVSEDYPTGPVGTNQVLFEKIRTNNLLSAAIQGGPYYIRVIGPNESTHRVELVAAAHEVEHPVTEGSIMAPATARGPVIAVGAADGRTTTPLRLSSYGPTNDGRRGVDLLAPGTLAQTGIRFTGTSAATAYTGGVVAILKAIAPSLSPAAIERVLQESAVPPDPGQDPLKVGDGLISPKTAVGCVS